MFDNSHNTWRQGRFVELARYDMRSPAWKDTQRQTEAYLVRSSPMQNAICTACSPSAAVWIAERLNLAADLERLATDFARGETDGQKLKDFIRSKEQSPARNPAP
ncbi:hypothetical protein AB1K42_15380 [Roseibium algicola]|uniref:hypothetical protein n=1 Tax=Roseibium algicola TaxID=2857014 RepID=UPI003458C1C1